MRAERRPSPCAGAARQEPENSTDRAADRATALRIPLRPRRVVGHNESMSRWRATLSMAPERARREPGGPVSPPPGWHRWREPGRGHSPLVGPVPGLRLRHWARRATRAALASVWLAVPLLGVAPVGAVPAAQTGGVEATVVADQELNVRAGPGLGEPVIGTLAPGARVIIVAGPVPGDGWTWCQHTGGAHAGWSVCVALATAQELQNLAGAPPTPAAQAAGAPPRPAPTGASAAATPVPTAAPRPTRTPPPPPPLTPVRLPPPQRATTGAPASAPPAR